MTTELDPVYINSVLGAFTSSLQGASQFDVYAVARAAKWVAESTDALSLPDGEGGFDRPTWNWAHMAAARFMGDLLLHEDRLDIARADELFDAVRPLAYLPHPTPEDEATYKNEPARYVSFALNTPRPVGVEAVIRFGRWLKLATPEQSFNRNQLARVFEVLESKLDAAQEPSAAVREMFGMQFRTLAWLDLDWFTSVMPLSGEPENDINLLAAMPD